MCGRMEPDCECLDRMQEDQIISLTAEVTRLKGEVAARTKGNTNDRNIIRELTTELAALQPVWTDEPPTVEGWYWHRSTQAFPTLVEWVSKIEGECWLNGIPCEDREEHQWSGPIPMPLETSEPTEVK